MLADIYVIGFMSLKSWCRSMS